MHAFFERFSFLSALLCVHVHVCGYSHAYMTHVHVHVHTCIHVYITAVAGQLKFFSLRVTAGCSTCTCTKGAYLRIVLAIWQTVLVGKFLVLGKNEVVLYSVSSYSRSQKKFPF